MGAYIFVKNASGSYNTVRFDVVFSESHVSESDITEHPVEQGVDVADHVNPKLYNVTIKGFVSNSPLLPVPGTTGADGFQPLAGEKGVASGLSIANTSVSIPTFVVNRQPYNTTLPGMPFLLSANPLQLLGNLEATVPQSFTVQGYAGSKGPDKNAVIRGYQIGDLNRDRVHLVDDHLRILREQAIVVTLVTKTRTYNSMMVKKVTLDRTPEDGSGGTFTVELRQIRIVSSKTVTAPIPTEVRGKTEVAKGSTSGQPVDPADRQSMLFKASRNGQPLSGLSPTGGK